MPKLEEAARLERRQHFVDSAWRCAARKGYRDMTVDDVCAEAGLSKGAFYGYFENKQSLLLALLEDDARTLDEVIERLGAGRLSSVERLRRFTREMLERGQDPAVVQLRADLWDAVLTQEAVRQRFASAVQRRRNAVRGWIEAGIDAGELVDIPANALASLLLALSDGLMLHNKLDPSGFRWPRIARALDVLFGGLSTA
jgi:AcrR family transcriptional regulator